MRKIVLHLRAALAACAVASTLALHADVGQLRCEYLVNPIGVDAVQPRLSWTLPDTKGNIRVFISEDSLAVAKLASVS